MKPILQDPYVWVDGRRYDLAHPQYVRKICPTCGKLADHHLFLHGECKPCYWMDCAACGRRRRYGDAQDVLDLVLNGAPAGCQTSHQDPEIHWVEWKRIRRKPGTGIGGKWNPREVVPPKPVKAHTCRSCGYCSPDPEPEGRWCTSKGEYRSPSSACCDDRIARPGC